MSSSSAVSTSSGSTGASSRSNANSSSHPRQHTRLPPHANTIDIVGQSSSVKHLNINTSTIKTNRFPSVSVTNLPTQTSTPTSSTSTPPERPSSGLRAQLQHLLPRHHADFRVRMVIHQLSSVPLVHGEFGVRWKFRHVRTEGGHKATLFGKGKEREREEGGEEGGGDGDFSAEGFHAAHPHHEAFTIPSVIISRHSSQHHHDDSASTPTTSTASPAASRSTPTSTSTSSSSTPSSERGSLPYAQYVSYDPSYNSSYPSSTASHTSPAFTTPLPPTSDPSPARGQTAFLQLYEHSVIWEHTIQVTVRMDVDRDTADLQRNELKLQVMQRVIPGDPDSPRNPRLGALYLNLAEYADAGPVKRRYLLRESKTNATLNLTLELTHIGGTPTYKPPPLPKGEIMGGITGLLDNDVYRTRPRTLDLYGLLGDGAGVDSEKQKEGGTKSKVRRPQRDQTLPFDAARLPLAAGPRTTEMLIEAIFNPVPTRSPRASPFTYHVQAEAARPGPEGPPEADAEEDGENASLRSYYTRSSEYTHTTSTSASSSGNTGPIKAEFKSWWQRQVGGGFGRSGTPVKRQEVAG